MDNWIEVNIGDVVRNSPDLAACVCIFRWNMEEFVDDFSSLLGVQSSIMGVILAIEHTKDVRYRRLWLESDFILVCQVFTSAQLIYWSITGRWNKYLSSCKHIDFKVTNICNKSNDCTRKLIFIRLNNIFEFSWYDNLLYHYFKFIFL